MREAAQPPFLFALCRFAQILYRNRHCNPRGEFAILNLTKQVGYTDAFSVKTYKTAFSSFAQKSRIQAVQNAENLQSARKHCGWI